MDVDNIDNSEILYRAVRKSNPDSFLLGKPTAALFMDDGGASVDRDGNRKEQEIVESYKNRFGRRDDYITTVKIAAIKCRSVGAYPNPIDNKKNVYHAEIWESKDERKVSLLKAIQLAQLCKEV